MKKIILLAALFSTPASAQPGYTPNFKCIPGPYGCVEPSNWPVHEANTKFYQVINFQHQIVGTWKTKEAAKLHITDLRQTYTDEGFYIVELNVVYTVGDIR